MRESKYLVYRLRIKGASNRLRSRARPPFKAKVVSIDVSNWSDYGIRDIFNLIYYSKELL